MPTQNLSFPTRSVYTFASHIPTHFICRFALHSTLQKLKNDAYQSRYSTLANSSVHRLIQTPGLLAARAAPANLCGREEAIYSPFSCLSISPVVVESSDSLHVLTCFTFLLFFYMYIYIYTASLHSTAARSNGGGALFLPKKERARQRQVVFSHAAPGLTLIARSSPDEKGGESINLFVA